MLVALLQWAFAPLGVSQDDEEVVELSPFVVDSSGDQGYRATNTLSGSRLNSSLGDTAASVSVFTEQFIEDLGLTEIDDLMKYTLSTVPDVGDDENNNGLVNNTFNATSIIRRVRTRGIESSKGLDYFESITPDDSYRVGRYDESRGPNGILFGVSNAGGITNQTSIVASTNRDSGKISLRLTDEGGMRSQIRLNRVLLEDRLGLTIAALDQEETGWRDGDYNDKERIFGAMTFKASDRLTLRANYESGHDRRALVKPITVRDQALAWWDNVQAGNENTLIYPWRRNNNNNSAAYRTDAQIEAGISGALGSNRYTYVVNDNTLFRADRTMNSTSYHNGSVLSPDGVPGQSGSAMNINDPSFVPYEINTIGTAGWRDTTLENYSLFADYRVTDNFFVNIAHNYQRARVDFPFVNGNNPQLRGDPNLTRGIASYADNTHPELFDEDGQLTASDAPVNPYAGMLYFESEWKRDFHEGDRNETRLSLSYDLDTERFGSHRFGAMVGQSSSFNVRSSKFLTYAGNPGDAGQYTSGTNRVRVRRYIENVDDISDWKQGDWRDVPEMLDRDGELIPIVWANDNPGNTNTAGGTDIDTYLAVSQSHFLNRKLVVTLGYREDSANFVRHGHNLDDDVGFVIDYDIIDIETAFTGKTKTAGVVYNLNDQVGLVANRGTSIGLPDFIRGVLPFGGVPDPSENDGEDFGIKFNLFDRRISGRVVYYTTNAIRQAVGGTFSGRNNTIMNNFEEELTNPVFEPNPIEGEDDILIRDAVYTDEEWAALVAAENLQPSWNARYQDTVSEGYELSLTANVTDSWRLTLNASKTDRIRSGVHGEAINYFGFTTGADGRVVEGVTFSDGDWVADPDAFTDTGNISRWFDFLEQGGLTLSDSLGEDGDSLGESIFDMIDTINDQKDAEEKRFGLRPYKVNILTAYDFNQGFLKGFTFGGGYRWQSSNITGEDDEGNEIEGLENKATDAFIRYKTKVDGRFKGTLSFQLNIDNLLDDGPIIPRRFSSDPDFYVPGGATPTSRGIAMSRFDLVQPRSYRFTTTFSF